MSELRCDSDGCEMRMILNLGVLDENARGHRDYVTQHTAAAIARAASWHVMHGVARDYHFCPVHRSRAALVLRFAAAEIRGEPRGIHAALRELGVGVLSDTERAVWTAFHKANGPHAYDLFRHRRDVLLEAARLAEEGA